MHEGAEGLKRLILLKVAALLHDPPHKAWIVLSKYRVRRGEGGSRERAHEEEARRVASELLKGTRLEESIKLLKDDVIRRADQLASSIDRVLYLWEGAERPWGTLSIANMFDPTLKYTPRSTIDEGNIQAFINSLRNTLMEVKDDLITAYHALYSLLEPAWFFRVRAVGPADTRVPNHTIFDHLYATATAVNFVENGKPSGFLVLLDIAGIQSFISKARKTIDFWASSWLVSALAWYLVREVVEFLGPDCLVMPTARMNPFYLTWLFGRARSRGYRKLASELMSNDLDVVVSEGWPVNPVMPGTMVLALPRNVLELLKGVTGSNASSIEEYFAGRFREGWRNVVEVVKNVLRSGFGESSEEVVKALDIIKENPPLMLRIRTVSIRDALIKLEEGLGDSGSATAMLYHHALQELFRRETSDAIAVHTGALINWSALTKDGKYRLCTVCGSLPAAVSWGEQGISEYLLMKEREYLCPYCLIKRALAQHTVLEKVVRVLVDDGVIVRKKRGFPSTADIAALRAKQAIIKKIYKMSAEEAEKLLSILINVLAKGKSSPPNISLSGSIKVLNKMLQDVRKTYGEEDPRTLLASLIALQDAEGVLVGNNRDVIQAIRDGGFANLSGDFKAPSYYAILSADADNIGELLAGKVWFMNGEDRVSALRRYYEEMLRGELEDPQRSADIRNRISKSVKRLNDIIVLYEKKFGGAGAGEGIFMPLSITYHSCISRALMATALKDSELISKFGVVVYAGGDDLKALLPVIVEGADGKFRLPLLEAVVSTRRAFWGMDSQEEGFILISGVSPALRGVGRSYSVRISHYRSPLRPLIESSNEVLKIAKSAVTWSLSNKVKDRKGSKDSTCVAYGREFVEVAVLPNDCGGEPGDALRIVTKLEELVREGRLSRSAVWDVEGSEGIIAEFLSRGLVDYAFRYLEEVILRNAGRGCEASVKGVLKECSALKNLVIGSEARTAWIPLELFRCLKLVLNGERCVA